MPDLDHIGFTGTKEGMTDNQKKLFEEELLKYNSKSTAFHHGDCIGADEQAHNIATKLGFYTIIHPPINDKYRAFCKGNVILPPLEYLDRNHDIVDSSKKMFATPKEEIEQIRSGTWATIRYSKKKKVPVTIINP